MNQRLKLFLYNVITFAIIYLGVNYFLNYTTTLEGILLPIFTFLISFLICPRFIYRDNKLETKNIFNYFKK